MARPWKSKLLWSDEVLMCYETQSSCLSFLELEQQLEIPNDRNIHIRFYYRYMRNWLSFATPPQKRILGACRSLSDQFSAQTLFDVFAKFHFQQLPKVTLTYIPLHSNPAGTIGTTIFFAVTLHSGGCIWSPGCNWRSALWHKSYVTYNPTTKQKPFNSKILKYSLF